MQIIDKKRVRECLKQYGYTMVPRSWYDGDTDEERYNAVFNAYDKFGSCYHFYVDAEAKHAKKQLLGDIALFDRQDATYIFVDYFFGD